MCASLVFHSLPSPVLSLHGWYCQFNYHLYADPSQISCLLGSAELCWDPFGNSTHSLKSQWWESTSFFAYSSVKWRTHKPSSSSGSQIHIVPSSFILHLLSGSVVRPFLFMMPPLPWSPSHTLLPRSSQQPICPSPQLLWSCSSLPYNTIRALVVKLCTWLKVLQCSCGGPVQAPCVAWGPLLPSSFPQALSCVCVQPLSVPLNFLFPLLRALIIAPQPPSHHIFRWLHPFHAFRGLRVDTALSRKAPVTTWIHPLRGPPPIEQKPLLHAVDLATVCAACSTVSAVRGGTAAACPGGFTPSGVHWSIWGPNKVAEVLLGNLHFLNKKNNPITSTLRRKSWLKTQHSKNSDHGIWSHHLMVNRWGNNGSSDRFYFLGLQNHCGLWLQPCN